MEGRAIVWVGRGVSALAVLVFAFSASMKLRGGPELTEGIARFGLAESLMSPLAALEATCALLYAVPQTTVLGAVLLTGYLGGAILTHLRVGDPIVVPIMIGLAVWLGVYLREPRLRSVLPVRSRLP